MSSLFRSFLGAAGVLITSVMSANAGNMPYALSCIGNATNTKINYFVKWGDADWTRVSASPQKWIWHSWQYDQKGESPELLVRFDADLSPGQTWIVQPLEKYAAESKGNSGDCEKYGRRYQFKRGQNQLIELTTID